MINNEDEKFKNNYSQRYFCNLHLAWNISQNICLTFVRFWMLKYIFNICRSCVAAKYFQSNFIWNLTMIYNFSLINFVFIKIRSNLEKTSGGMLRILKDLWNINMYLDLFMLCSFSSDLTYVLGAILKQICVEHQHCRSLFFLSLLN